MPLDKTVYISGNLTKVLDGRGNTTSYTYDATGNLTLVISPGNAREILEYDLAGRLSALTDPRGVCARYNYDELNRLTTLAFEQDSSAGLTYTYDERGQVTERTDRTGSAHFAYDSTGLLLSETDGAGRSVVYAYDGSGRLSRLTYADGSSVSYGYDGAGNLTAVTDGTGTYAYTYDELNRPLTLTRPDGSLTTSAYDERGSITALENRDASGSVLSRYSYTYDVRGSVAAERSLELMPGGERIETNRSFAYTATGELAQINERTLGGESPLEQTTTVAYTYDEAGNRISCLITAADGSKERLTYTYDADNRLLTRLSSRDGLTTYAYDEAGNLVSKRADAADELTYSYGVEGRLMAVREGGVLLMAAVYDGDGNRSLQLNRVSVSGSLTYTPGAQRTTSKEEEVAQGTSGAIPGTPSGQASIAEPAESPESGSEGGLDLFWYGVWQAGIHLFAAPNPAVAASAGEAWHTYWQPEGANDTRGSPDAEGSDSSGSGSGSGSSTGAGSATAEGAPGSQAASPFPNTATTLLAAAGLSLDELALIQVAGLADEGTQADTTYSTGWSGYAYELISYLNSTLPENTQVLATYTDTGTLKESYTYGLTRLSKLTASQPGVGSGRGNASPGYVPEPSMPSTSYYLTDARGSVTALAASGASGSAAIKASYAYDAFGTPTTSLTGAAAELPSFGYNAEEYNPLTGTLYLRSRYLNVADSRFGTPDSYRGNISSPLTLNRYLYANANPLLFQDPSGHWNVLGALGGALSAGAHWVNNNVIQPVVHTAVSLGSASARILDTYVVKPVVGAVKSAGNFVYNNVVKPVSSWFGQNVITPALHFSTNALTALQRTTSQVYRATGQLITTVGQGMQDAGSWIGQQAHAAREQVVRFACGSAEFISHAWEGALDTLAQIDWAKVGQVATVVGVGTVAVVAIVASAGTAAPLVGAGLAAFGASSATAAVAGSVIATAGAVTIGGTVAATALSDAGEIVTGHNFIRDYLMGGNKQAYDVVRIMNTIAGAGYTGMVSSAPSASSSSSARSNAPASAGRPPFNGAVPGTEEEITLTSGSVVGRYGAESSRYVAYPGTPPEKLSIPPTSNIDVYNEYLVRKDIPNVIRSVASAWYGQPGGGIQYELPRTVQELLRLEMLSRITSNE